MTPPDASTNALPLRSVRRPASRPAAARVVSDQLRARKRRVSQIRRRVAAIATAMFLATSGGIFVQLVTGNDPALATSTAKTATTTAASTASGSAIVTASSGSSSSGAGAGSSSSGSGNAGAVTTRQS